ncbi:MAG TPA: Chromate resistance protein ChrB [Ktedonobacteraceae bacterium]|nr:Chromate resistance protein ChrB [Ktedonobacteraceae bacterium]
MDSHSYILLIYQVPSQPSAARVSVWRELKKMGALYLQQSVCILPAQEPLQYALQKITERIGELGGGYHLLPLNELPGEEEEKIVDGFIAQSNLQYDEIIENCQVNFSKEIEFETFRQNFTYAEVEEIGQELDKIHRWYDRVVERDWFGAARREEALRSIEHSEKLLEEFEEKVFLTQDADEASDLPSQKDKKHLHPRRYDRTHVHNTHNKGGK